MLLLSVSACDRPSNEARDYQHLTDRWIVRLGLPIVGIQPCRGRTRMENGSKFELPPPVDECYEMQPSRHWTGIWTLGPGEHDEQFCPTGAGACSLKSRPSYTLDWRRHPIGNVGWSKRYEVDFVGRRTSYPLKMLIGDETYVIVVDRLNSMKDLGPLLQQKPGE